MGMHAPGQSRAASRATPSRRRPEERATCAHSDTRHSPGVLGVCLCERGMRLSGATLCQLVPPLCAARPSALKPHKRHTISLLTVFYAFYATGLYYKAGGKFQSYGGYTLLEKRMKVGEHEVHQSSCPPLHQWPSRGREGVGRKLHTWQEPSRRSQSRSSERPKKASHAHKQTRTAHPASWVRVRVRVAGHPRVSLCHWCPSPCAAESSAQCCVRHTVSTWQRAVTTCAARRKQAWQPARLMGLRWTAGGGQVRKLQGAAVARKRREDSI